VAQGKKPFFVRDITNKKYASKYKWAAAVKGTPAGLGRVGGGAGGGGRVGGEGGMSQT